MGRLLQAGNLNIIPKKKRFHYKPSTLQVLFPLLSELLTEKPAKPADFGLLEESRMRTATIMSKVFLHHLNPLIGLAGFNELWLEILDYFERFMKIGSDMLYEAVLESLKNMLLVMHSVSRVSCVTLVGKVREFWN